jgi:hypothetical protein
LPHGLTVTGLRVEYDVICASCHVALPMAEDAALPGAPSCGSSRSTPDGRNKRHA